MLVHVFYIYFGHDGKVLKAYTTQFHYDLLLLDAVWDTETQLNSFIWWYSFYLSSTFLSTSITKWNKNTEKNDHSEDQACKSWE